MQAVGAGQQGNIGIGEFVHQTVLESGISLGEFPARSPTFDDPRELLTRVVRRAPRVAQDQSLARLLQALVAKPVEDLGDVPVSVVVPAGGRELDLDRPGQKRPQLLQRR